MLLRQPSEMSRALDRLHTCAGQNNEPDPDLHAEAVLIPALARVLSDRVDGVEPLIHECLSRTDTLEPWTLSVAASAAAFLAIYRFEFDRASEWQNWAAPYQQQVSGTFSLMYSHCLTGLAAREQLDIAAAERSFRTAWTL